MAQVSTEESVDSISSLPDSILAHILSFLPTKVASLGYNPNGTNLFMDFVDRFILLMNGTPIDKFRLKCSYAVENSRVHSWIAPLLCNVRELDLCISEREPGKEYSCDFTYNTLVVLKLGTGISLNVPASVTFPCLKTLQFQLIRLPNKDSLLQRLVPSCPVLEDLLIVGCDMEDVPVLSLSSPSLKRLTIDGPTYHHYELELDTPSLVYLKFDVSKREENILKNLCSLREVRIYIGYLAHNDLFEGLVNVQSLYLSGFVEKFLRKTLDVVEELPLLKNLTRLVLNDKSYLETPVVMKLLRCCPNLEEFVSKGSLHGGYHDVPRYVPSRLRSVESVLFYDRVMTDLEDVEPLEYFLKNASMLEKMRIHIQWCYSLPCREIEKSETKMEDKLKTMMETMKKLVNAPSRSKTCKINVFFQREGGLEVLVVS